MNDQYNHDHEVRSLVGNTGSGSKACEKSSKVLLKAHGGY